MKTLLTTALLIASTTVFAQTATINGQGVALTQDSAPVPTNGISLSRFEYKLNTSETTFITSDYQNITVLTTEDAVTICDFARGLGISYDVIISVVNGETGRCKQ